MHGRSNCPSGLGFVRSFLIVYPVAISQGGPYALSLYGVRAAHATNALVDKLDDPHMAYMAARALGEIGLPARAAIPRIAALLKSEKIDNRVESAMALSKLQPLPDDVVLQIKELLLDADPLVRDFARKASVAITINRMQVASQQPTATPGNVTTPPAP